MAPNSSSAYPWPARCGTEVSTSKKAISGPPAAGGADPSGAAAGAGAGDEPEGVAIASRAGAAEQAGWIEEACGGARRRIYRWIGRRGEGWLELAWGEGRRGAVEEEGREEA